MTSHDTIVQAERQMQNCVLEIGKLAQDVANAKTVKEFNSDRVKQAFSVATAGFLEAGDTTSAAEHKARAGRPYGDMLGVLVEQYRAAMETIEQYDALKLRFESARSILSTEKAKLGLL